MKKMTFFASVLAAIALTACSNENDPVVDDPSLSGDRVLKINVSTLTTKAEHPGGVTGLRTKIEDGSIYFFDRNENAVFQYSLTGPDMALLNGSSTKQTIDVPNVPTSALSVMLITNYAVTDGANSTYPAVASQSKSAIEALSFNIENMQPRATGYNNVVDKVVMSGEAVIMSTTEANNTTTHTANIQITPVLSRMEVGSVRCATISEGLDQPGQITKFRLKGIFIPNHYAAGSVLGVGNGSLVNPANDGTKYTAASFPTPNMFDVSKDANTLTKVSTNYFAYHTFPAVGAANLPHVVVAVDNVWFIDNDKKEYQWKNGATQYFVVSKYTNNETGATTGAALAEFAKAQIYRISGTDPGTTTIDPATGKPSTDSGSITVTVPGGTGGIEFGLDDLTDKPYDKDKTVSCNITILGWTLVPIAPAK
ncbi:MAG TPA: hypothetical protein DCF91_01645 [Porphyromonadaceae bacterium]|nr:hypothetical protein [Porphyromonadaceae bacterium]